MLAKVKSCSLIGLNVHDITIEVDAAGGLPSWEIVGLPDTAVKESKERVRTAIKNAGFDFPPRRIVVNLAPADIKKEGPCFDLPIALAILAATNQLDSNCLKDYIVLGELGLDGSLRKVKGILPVSLENADNDVKLIVPLQNSSEGAVGGCSTFGFSNLYETVEFLKNPLKRCPQEPPELDKLFCEKESLDANFKYIKAQREAKRALEIAAAGGHNLLMVGPPGSGKTMLAKAFAGILPELSIGESLDITKIYSVAGLLSETKPLITKRPFRSPHHNASQASVIGGGRVPGPGEVSLSSNGVLFLDELPEFSKDVLEALRQPLEEGVVTVSRVAAQLTYPASFILLAAMNPCPCGFWGDSVKECTCTPYQVQKYRNKVSGPLLDRIDIQIEVNRLEFDELQNEGEEEDSLTIRERVAKARAEQKKRFRKQKILSNAEMKTQDLKKYCKLDKECKELMHEAFDRLGLSARAHDRILKVARTIADLEGSEKILIEHLAEAVSYRAFEKSVYD